MMRPERHPARIAAGYAGLVGVALFVTVPVYIFVEPPSRALVTRLATALVLGTVLLELRAALLRRLSAGGDSPLDDARGRSLAEPGVPPRLLALVGDVRAAVRSRRYFDNVFWPRLLTLARRAPERPRVRRGGRGPSLASLQDAIADIERES